MIVKDGNWQGRVQWLDRTSSELQCVYDGPASQDLLPGVCRVKTQRVPPIVGPLSQINQDTTILDGLLGARGNELANS